jgi:hypothetical protein
LQFGESCSTELGAAQHRFFFLRHLHAGGSPDGCWIGSTVLRPTGINLGLSVHCHYLTFHLMAVKPSLLPLTLFLLLTLEWAILCNIQLRPNSFVRLRRLCCEVAYTKTRLALFRFIFQDWKEIETLTANRSQGGELIMVESQKTLQHADPVAKPFNLMDSRGWIFRLPPH